MTGTCETNGVRLSYTRTGGDKPPLLLLHGLTANGACWTPLARELEDRYDVVMPDARGHGHSSAPEHGYRYEDHAADVIALIQALGLSSPIVLGHSMGGMTAALAAAQRPKLLHGLVLADPTFLTPERQREVHESDVGEQHRRALSRPRDEVLAELRARHARRSSEVVELIAQARLQTSISAFEVLTPPTPEFRQLVSALGVPTLLVIGGAGGVVSPELALELQSLNANVQLQQIVEAGHGLHYDQPDRFSAVVKAFLSSVGR
jgi:N-formylmaleamate deformylase